MSESTTRTGRGFLNINAEDFGIEFDRIAKVSVGSEAVFCDGELRNAGLLNRVVGLFEMNQVQESVDAKGEEFKPDRIFWDGVDRTGDAVEEVIDGYLARRGSSWKKLVEDLKTRAGSKPPANPLNLCPVTRTIVDRHRRLRAVEAPPPRSAPDGRLFDVFVSFASEDLNLAREVYNQVTASNRRAFFSDVTLTGGGFADQIDDALDSATAFVAVGRRAEHLEKSWGKYEWRNFHNDLNSGRKPERAPFFAFVEGFDPQDLPRPLRLQQAIVADKSKHAALEMLTQYISRR